MLTLLKPYATQVRELALETRPLVLDAVPKTCEVVDLPPPRLVANGWRASLPDPHGLMRGTGKLHRHVAIRSDEDLFPELAELLRLASRRMSSTETTGR